MSKKKKGLILTTSLLSAMMTACTCAGVIAMAAEDTGKPVTPYAEAGLVAPIAERVKVGDVVEIPDYYYEKENGDVVKASVNVLMPSGKVYSGAKFTITDAGRYTVEYIVGGKVVNTEYCTATLSGMDMITVSGRAQINGINEYAYRSDYKGVSVDVESGAVISFNQLIDMTTLTKNDLLFKAIVEPRTYGNADFEKMTLTFTDSEDDSIYFKVNAVDGHADGGSPKQIVYLNGAANGQVTGGFNHTSSGPVWQAKDIYGTVISSSFRAVEANGQEYFGIEYYYDSAEKTIYTNRYGMKSKVVDFDDPAVFGGTAWSGFPSGKAKLTISFSEVAAGGGRVILNSIAGFDMKQEEIVDDEAPTLSIDLLGERKAPNALLGTEYAVFPYTTYDFYDTSVDVNVSVVYENLLTGAKTDVVVKDGKFVTDKIGKYTIYYVATDYSGNMTEEALSFECIAKAEELSLSGLPADFSSKIFESVRVPHPAELKANGGNGNLKISVAAYDPDGKEIALNQSAFLPEKLGVYEIVYTVVDFYGVSKEWTLNVTSVENDIILTLNEIVLPELLVKGFSYTVPQIYAKTCFDGKVVDCVIDYFVNGVQLDETRTFAAEGESVTVVCHAYAAGDPTNYKELTANAIVIDGEGGKDHSAYFYNGDGSVQIVQNRENVEMTANTDGIVEFANILRGDSFSVGMICNDEYAKFETFDLVLCDVKTGATVTFTLTVDYAEGDSTAVAITVPHGEAVEYPNSQGYFKLEFSFASGFILDANGSTVALVTKDDAGNPISAFSEGLYLKMRFNGVWGESKIALSSLNNQMLGYRLGVEEEANGAEPVGDDVGPDIEVLGELSVRAEIGSTLTVYEAKAYDVLSQVTSVTVLVQDPDGNRVLNDSPADKEYTVDLTKTGYYRVVYTAYDSLGNRSRYTKNVVVFDSVAPTLNVSVKDVTKSVGSTIQLPKIKASDDSENVYYDVFLLMPTSEVRLLVHSENGEITSYLDKDDETYPNSFKVSNNSFKVEMKGEYVVTIMAYDDDYNLTMASYTITVK